jgi:ABC-type multidrug transport system permease subunit
MREVFHLAAHDFRLTLRDRASFFWMLVLPVALMWLFGQMHTGGTDTLQVRLTVVDRDGGWLARAFIEQLESPNVRVVERTPEEAAAEEKKVRTLVIPEGFTEKVVSGDRQALRFEHDEGTSAGYDRAADGNVLRAIARTLALLVEMDRDETLRSEEAGDVFAALAARPRLIGLDVSTAGRGRPVPGGRAQSVPGILTMTVLMMTVIYGGVFLTLEKRDGTLRRQAAGPVGRAGLFAGKLFGRLLLAAAQTVVLVLFGRFAFGVEFGSSPIGLFLLLFSYAFCCASLAVLCGAIFRTPEQASGIGWLLSIVMAALGGCWWPSEVVPRWLWSAAHVFPTAWAMDAFHALISFGRGTEALVLPSLVLLGFGLFFAAVGSRFLRY